MKKLIILSLMLIFALSNAYGQSSLKTFLPDSKITPYALQVGYDKTTILIFPAAISQGGIDRGSSGIIAKTVPGVDNILKVKANTKGFTETNLTVITEDGKVYPFTINYSDNPPDAPIDIGKQGQHEKQLASFSGRELNTEQINDLCKEVANKEKFLHQKTKSFKIKLQLEGIYIIEDVMFYQFRLKNKSAIDYTINFPRFYIRDRKRVKRTAQQEKEIQPLQIYYKDGTKQTDGKTNQTIVIAFSKFTIADHKNFVMQLFEKQGDRNLELKIIGDDIIKARPISF
jgi:conjugative transposon TraN protein